MQSLNVCPCFTMYMSWALCIAVSDLNQAGSTNNMLTEGQMALSLHVIQKMALGETLHLKMI